MYAAQGSGGVSFKPVAAAKALLSKGLVTDPQGDRAVQSATKCGFFATDGFCTLAILYPFTILPF